LANANTLAARGHSRDHRPDCKQVCIGLVVTREGYPLGYEIFPGNKHDSKTLQEIVARMEERYGSAGRIWAVDGGMVSEANLKWLKERGSRYIVGTPKSQLQQFEAKLLSGEWSQVRDGLDVQAVPGESGVETFILCRSADRAAKERAMRERFEQRIEIGLKAIAAACERRRCDMGVIERRVGRLLGRNSRAAGLYDVQVTRGEKDRARFSWTKRTDLASAAQRREGCYLRRSNVSDWRAEDLWVAYMQLTEAEAAFRIQKDQLKLRPIWRQKTERVQAHIPVCFLAYVLRKTLEGWSKRAGLGSSVTTIMEELARIDSTDVMLPTSDGRTLRIRCVVRPDQAQSILLHRLGLELPRRLRLPQGLRQM
jgi:transposase